MTILSIGSCRRNEYRLEIGIIAPSTNHLPLLIALEDGIISEEKIMIHRFLSGWEVNEALIGGRIDLAIMPFTYAWKGVSEGKELKIISFLERESDGIISRKEITNKEDLNGIRVGVLRASTLDIFLSLALDELGIEPEIVYFRTPTEMAVAFGNGHVDALSFYVPPIFQFDDRFSLLFWYSEVFPEHPCCDIIANERSLASKGELIRDFLRAIEAGCDILNTKQERGVSAIVNHFGYDETIAKNSLNHQKFITGLEDEGKLFQERVAEKMEDLGYLRRRVELKEVYHDIFEND